jgi:hypothetical protein
MSKINTSSAFLSYELTDEEIRRGSVFSHEQKMVIQNQIAALAEEQINTPFSTELIVLQRNAENLGSINALRYLLDCSKVLEKENVQELKDQAAIRQGPDSSEQSMRSPFDGARMGGLDDTGIIPGSPPTPDIPRN